MKNNLIYFGKILKTHGLKGHLKVYLENREDSILEKGMEVTIRKDNSYIQKRIENISLGNDVIILFSEVNTIDLAQDFSGCEFYLSRDNFPEIDSDEVYLVDLVGFKVVNHISGNICGELVTFYDNGAQSVAVVKLLNNEEVDIIFIKEFFPVIDMEKKQVEVIIPEYV